ncbi:protein FAM200C-like [Parasteatoda tepidariorum]|uniref:protein FAM200C-like n=1 Tax=Parasteatoda tepidariorum TaxID=114398 RepID=UPI0039BCB084
MSEDIEKQLAEKLKTRKFPVQMDESTLIYSVAVLITYVRYIDKGHFAEEMLFYGAPNMMGKKNCCLKLMKDENPEMILVHCVINRENLVAKNILTFLNEVLHSVIKCINTNEANAKYEHLFKLFCEKQKADHVRLLLHTELRWLSKGNCLKRILELFDTFSDSLSDKLEMKYLLTLDGKAFVSYLADIFEKLNTLTKRLQGTNETLVGAKAKIFGFITLIELSQKYINNKNF